MAADMKYMKFMKSVLVPAMALNSLAQGRWINAGRIIFAEHELLAIGRFDLLVW